MALIRAMDDPNHHVTQHRLGGCHRQCYQWTVGRFRDSELSATKADRQHRRRMVGELPAA
jgi:hypothetical protein